MSDTKYISSAELKVGMEIEGYKKGCTSTLCTKEIVSIEDDKVTFNWGEPLENASDYIFSIKLNDEELAQKYKDAVKEIKEALTHKLGQVDGYHEMWNSWLYADNLVEMASNLKANKLRIIGYATLTVPKLTMFGMTLDIGVVAEYEDGQRIWCHTSDAQRKRLLSEGEDYENL